MRGAQDLLFKQPTSLDGHMDACKRACVHNMAETEKSSRDKSLGEKEITADLTRRPGMCFCSAEMLLPALRMAIL